MVVDVAFTVQEISPYELRELLDEMGASRILPCLIAARRIEKRTRYLPNHILRRSKVPRCTLLSSHGGACSKSRECECVVKAAEAAISVKAFRLFPSRYLSLLGLVPVSLSFTYIVAFQLNQGLERLVGFRNGKIGWMWRAPDQASGAT